jgi:hypothetical protein
VDDSFSLYGDDGTFEHSEESLLHAFTAYVARAF